RSLLRLRTWARLPYHLIDQLVELGAIHYLDKRGATRGVTHHVDGGSVVESYPLAHGVVCLDLGGELTRGIDDKGECDLVVGSEALGHAAQVLRRDLGLVGEYEQPVVVAQLLRLGVEVTRIDRRFERPVMHGQRKVVL